MFLLQIFIRSILNYFTTSTEACYSKHKRIQTVDVVNMAAIVPLGMERCASFKSPDLLEPAIIPKQKYTIDMN